MSLRTGSVRRAPLAAGVAVGGVLLLAAVVLSIGVGPIALAPRDVVAVVAHELFGAGDGGERLATTVVMDLRMPRVLFGSLAGAALAASGAALQSLFNNPLADPGVIGVSGGASAGAVLAIVALPAAGGSAWAVPAAAFAGGLLATGLIYALARPGRGTGTSRLLLVGIAVGAACASITGFCTFMADDDQLRDIVFWQMGSLASVDWTELAIGAVVVAAGVAVLVAMHRRLDMLTLGERQARHLGLDVTRARAVLVVVTALLTAVTVAFAGIIGFVGLVVPHIVRMAFGPAHRALIPMSALVGGLLIVLADTAARTVAPPSEVPIGLFTSALGAPFFLWLVLRERPGAGA
ncbi:FecCD family ABC transporter permease [Isoptericola sp. NPDC056578]|uniref:FecCD family ABC transporter permease n=1 Tax=Isoptericola sp. NPDC056578 TaxID=3345870 RepID=UPI00367746F9